MYAFFWSLLKYKVSESLGQLTDSELQKQAHAIRLEAEKLNPVWQKFCQTLACRDDLIGEVLAQELRHLLDKCPSHTHELTYEIVKQELPTQTFSTPFSDKYLIGSGTIAQVYKVFNTRLERWVALKIKHPNIDIHIQEALEQYHTLSRLIIFPKNLIACGNEFFAGLAQQANFSLEFEMGLKMRSQLYDSINHSTHPSIFCVPKMLVHSPSLIMMEYEAGDYSFMTIPAGLPSPVPGLTMKELVGLMIIHIQVVCIYYGLVHSDLHWGNFSIRLNPFMVILYDFGWVLDLSHITLKYRKEWATALLNRDAIATFTLMLRLSKLSKEEQDHHINNIESIVAEIPAQALFSVKFKRVLLYYQMHGLDYDENIIAILYSCVYSEHIEKMLEKALPAPNKVAAYLPYAEFACLAKFI